METKKPIPKFASETEEARWWDEHRDDLDEYMSEPAPEAQVRLDSLLATLPPRQAAVSTLTPASRGPNSTRTPMPRPFKSVKSLSKVTL
jgi:hypothetical protein